jgi:hypothetical protein
MVYAAHAHFLLNYLSVLNYSVVYEETVGVHGMNEGGLARAPLPMIGRW